MITSLVRYCLLNLPKTVLQFFNFFLACVAWRFWSGELSNKGGRGQRNREEIGAGATSPLVRPARQKRHATQANFLQLVLT